jgi:serine/threonine protein kinase
MTATALPENYCICVGDDGAPRELWRSGAAVTYKAMGYQSGRTVALQLIPLASVTETGRAQFDREVGVLRNLKHSNIARVFDVREEDEHLVFATEFLQGETAERWVVTHGPMPADAVLRIGLQVVSALAGAAFHNLSHRAIQPSNLMIVTGAAPDGDWPFVKLLHFGLAGLKLYSDGKEVVPPIGPAFASPEQLENGNVDFRSEIFSLGATMCFLLTGDVPLARRARKSGPGERSLPKDVPVPRPVRRLLRRMLRVDPDDRPHDPLVFADDLRACLKKVERRSAFRRAERMSRDLEPERKPAVVAEAYEPETRDQPRFFAAMLAGVTVLLLLGAFGMILLSSQMRWWQRHRAIESIGVPIGIDESAPAESAAPPKEEMESVSPTPIAESSPVATPVSQQKTEPVIAEQSVTPAPPPPAVNPTPEETPAAENSSVSQTSISDADSPRNMSPSAVENSSPATQEAESQVPARPPAAGVPPEQTPVSAIAENPSAPQPASSGADSSTNSSPTPALENSSAVAHEAEVQIPTSSPSATPADGNPAPPGEGPPVAVPSPPAEVTLEKPIQYEPPAASEQKSKSPIAPRGRTGTPQKPTKNATSPRRSKANISQRKVREVKPPLRALPVNDLPPVVVLPPED